MENKNKIITISIISLLGLFLVFVLLRFINALFLALILFVFLRPLYKYLENKGLKKSLCSWIVIIISIFIILIPSLFVINLVTKEVMSVIDNKDFFIQAIANLDEKLPIEIIDFIKNQTPNISEFLKNLVVDFSQGVFSFVMNLFITYFILYYLLVDEDKIKEKIYNFSPFVKENTTKVLNEFRNVTHSTIISTGIIALIQGGLLTLSFFIFGVPGAIFWGLMATILSFIPVLGAPFIWIPVVIFQFLQGNYFTGVGLLIFGLFLSNVDNVIRPYLQRKVGGIHPLISVIGVFMGIFTFGLIGVVIGPLLLCYFILIVKIFMEEFDEI